MQFYYNNVVLDLADDNISSTTENPNFPLLNLKDKSPEIFYRTSVLSAQRIVIDAGAGNTFSLDAIALFNHNFTSSVTVRIEGNATDVWTAPSFTQTLTYKAGAIAEPFSGGTKTYRFFSLYLNDTTNPDLYIQLGQLFLGTLKTVSFLAPIMTLSRNTYSVQQVTRTGAVRGGKVRNYFQGSLDLTGVTDTERAAIIAVYDSAMNVDPVVLLVWEESLDVQPPIYAVINQTTLQFSKESDLYQVWAVSLNIKEVF